MNIIKKTPSLTASDIYALTKGNDVKKMRDALGEDLEISKFVLYNDTDIKGNDMQVLAVETVQGVRYATNSRTFCRNFADIVEIHESSGENIPSVFHVGSAKSKNGREYITCDIVTK